MASIPPSASTNAPSKPTSTLPTASQSSLSLPELQPTLALSLPPGGQKTPLKPPPMPRKPTSTVFNAMPIPSTRPAAKAPIKAVPKITSPANPAFVSSTKQSPHRSRPANLSVLPSKSVSFKDLPPKASTDNDKDHPMPDVTPMPVSISQKPSAMSTSMKTTAGKAADTALLNTERSAFEASLQQASTTLEAKLKALETDIEQKEEQYITKTWAHGNIMRGWDGFVRRVDRADRNAPGGTGSGTATGAPKYRKSRPSDRIFSLSSLSSRYRKENPDLLIQKRPPDKKKKKKR